MNAIKFAIKSYPVLSKYVENTLTNSDILWTYPILSIFLNNTLTNSDIPWTYPILSNFLNTTLTKSDMCGLIRLCQSLMLISEDF